MNTLAHGRDWSGENLAGWWAQRKIDGLRCYWTGSALLSREGHAFPAPPWFLRGLPAMPLDGELTRDGEGCAKANGLLRGKDANQWALARLHFFDAPGAKGGIAERVVVAARAITGCELAEVLETWQIASTTAVLDRLARLIEAGGEGIIARPDAAPYRSGRTAEIVKLKRGALDYSTLVAQD